MFTPPAEVKAVTTAFASLFTRPSWRRAQALLCGTLLAPAMEGQRQWNDLAIARSTPLRLALFSLVALLVHRQPGWQASVRQAAWYKKTLPTFSDALAQVRGCLWRQLGFCLSAKASDKRKPPANLFEHLGEMLAYAA